MESCNVYDDKTFNGSTNERSSVKISMDTLKKTLSTQEGQSQALLINREPSRGQPLILAKTDSSHTEEVLAKSKNIR